MSALRTCRASVVAAALAASTVASAGAPHAGAPAHRPAPQGVAVVASCGVAASDAAADAGARSPSQDSGEPTCRERTLALARAVYASSLRPRSLDEVRARVLAGEPPPPSATKRLRDLDELRGAVAGEDAVSRRLLSNIAEEVGVEALLVVRERGAGSATPSAVDAGASEAGKPATVPTAADTGASTSAAADAGASDAAPTASGAEEAGAPESTPPTAAASRPVVARLFLAGTGELDAARYEPQGSTPGPDAWRATVASLTGRFWLPRAAEPEASPRKPSPREETANKPFYASPWLWGAIGAAALVGGLVWFTSQDTHGEPIHLQMRVPR